VKKLQKKRNPRGSEDHLCHNSLNKNPKRLGLKDHRKEQAGPLTSASSQRPGTQGVGGTSVGRKPCKKKIVSPESGNLDRGRPMGNQKRGTKEARGIGKIQKGKQFAGTTKRFPSKRNEKPQRKQACPKRKKLSELGELRMERGRGGKVAPTPGPDWGFEKKTTKGHQKKKHLVGLGKKERPASRARSVRQQQLKSSRERKRRIAEEKSRQPAEDLKALPTHGHL